MSRKAWLTFLIAIGTSGILTAADAKKDQPVRKLTVTVDPLQASKLSGKPGARAFHSTDEVEKSLGEGIAKQIAGQLDFAKEDLVHVGWGSSGPPFGKLQHEIKEGKEGKIITFFIRQPKTLVQGQAYRLGNDFFAVPKGFRVKFGGAR